MAKFRIETTDGSDEKTVEAASYTLGSGYFWFVNQQSQDVFTIVATDVISVERVQEN